MEHKIKILPKYYEEVKAGIKTFELRKNDRNYMRDDTICLMEWDGEHYTGREIRATITYVLVDCEQYGLMDGYCILGIKPFQEIVHIDGE